MTANTLDLRIPEASSEIRANMVHPARQGSVTFAQAEGMAVKQFGDRSAAAIAKVLTDSGLALR